MARIPVSIGQRSLDTGNVIQFPNEDPAAAALGQVGEHASSEFGKLAEHFQNRQDRIEKFTQLSNFDVAKTNIYNELDKSTQQDMPANGLGFHDQFMKDKFAKARDDALANVPESLKPEYQARWNKAEADFSRIAAKREADQSITFQRQGISKQADDAAQNIIQLGDQTTDQWKAHVDTYIDSSSLSPAEKAALKPEIYRSLEKAQWIALRNRDPAAAQAIAAKWVGAPASLADKIIGVESGGDATARNPNSTATGAGQFTEGTWLQMIRSYRPELAEGRSREDVLALRNDPKLSKEMVGNYARENEQQLRSAGLPATPGSLYLAHFLGAGDAKRVLSVSADTPVDQLVSSRSIAANASVLQGKTAGEVIAWAENKMGGPDTPGRDPRFRNLTVADILTLSGNADKEQSQLDALRQKQSAADDKASKEDVLKEAFSRSEQGNLTPDYVESIRHLVSPTEYKNLLGVVRHGATADDKEAILDLVPKVDTLNPDEFQRAAVRWVGEGKLKTETFTSLVEKNRSASKDDQPASPYKSARSLVNSTLDPGQLLSGPAAAVARNAQQQALTEFDNWFAANPRAERGEAMSQAQDVVRRYQQIPYDQMKTAIGMSPYFGTKTRNQVEEPDIAQAEKRLNQDIESNTLTPEQQAFEIQRLQSWRDVLRKQRDAEEAAAAAKAKGSGSGRR